MARITIVSASFACLLLIAPCKSTAGNDTETAHNNSGHDAQESFLAIAAASSTSSSCIARLDEECGLLVGCGAGATCSWGNCHCNQGTCAGVDERCYDGNYERLPGTYRISNSRWPDYFIKMNAGLFGGSSVTKDGGSETEFYISVVHGPPNGGLAVLITSVKWPDYALAMEEYEYETSYRNASHGRALSGRRRRKVEYHRLDDKRLDDHAEVEDTASLLYRPPESNPHPNATMVMIRGIDEDVFAYVPPLSWDIAGDDDDQGAGMYWYIDPPLPENLVRSMHAYMGDRCEWDCGDPLISGAMGCGQFLMTGVVTFAMLLVIGMPWLFEM